MQPYQNYYPQQAVNPYQQNFNQNMQMQNPYIDRSGQLQQFQQGQQVLPAQMPGSYQQPGLIGKVVNDVSAVSPNDVPMDGNIAIFPKNDMSEIYCKQWKQDGTIQTAVYRPVQTESGEQGSNVPQTDFNALNEDVRALREEIREVRGVIEKSISAPAGKAQSRGRKAEAGADE